jgi:hypothetical protein
MGRSCTICAREDRDELERRLVAGEPVRQISRQAAVSRDALARHAASHLPATIGRLRDAGETLEGARVLNRLEALFAESRAVLATTRREGRHTISLGAIRELRATAELIARITGELDERPAVAVSLVTSSEWIEVRSAIRRALEPYPDASRAVVEALAVVAVEP